MSLMTIDEFIEFADEYPELADTVRTTYAKYNSFDEQWNSFVDAMMSQDMTYGGSVEHCMSTVV